MDFNIPYEYKQLQLLVRDYIESELRPLEVEVDNMEDEIDDELWGRLLKRAQELGIYPAFAPEPYGGGIRSWLAHILVSEEIGKTNLAFRHLMDTGFEEGVDEATEYQLEKFYIPLWRGEKRLAGGITEPDAGSDNLAMKTTAVKQNGKWVINGMKHFVSHASRADFFFIVTMSDPQQKRVSIFLIDKDTPGFTVGKYQKMMGFRGGGQYEVYLDNVVVPQENLIGEEGKGLRIFFALLNLYRLRVGAWGIGAADYALQNAISYAKQRVTFGQPLATRQAIQGMIVDSWAEIESARWLTYHTCWKADQKCALDEIILPAAMCKIMGSELGCKVLDRTIQIYGGIGYTCDLPFERLYRDQRGLRILEGSNELLKHVVAARQLLKD